MNTQSIINWQIAQMEAARGSLVSKELDGVPRMVQHVTYSFSLKLFVARLFNGHYVLLDDGVVQGLGLFSLPGSEHFMDLEPVIERLVLQHRLYLQG